MSDSLWPHGLQHARLHCPSPTPRAFTSTELVMPAKHFILCCHLLLLPSIFPSIRVLSMRQFFASGGQSIGASASASVLPMNIQDWFPLGLTGLISTVVQGTLKSLLQHHSSKVSILWHSAFLMVQFSHPYMTTGKTIALTRWTFLSKVMSLLCNMLSRLVITSLPRSKGLNFMAAVTICSDFGAPEIKSATVYTISPSICQEVMRPGAMIFVFWMLSFKVHIKKINLYVLIGG